MPFEDRASSPSFDGVFYNQAKRPQSELIFCISNCLRVCRGRCASGLLAMSLASRCSFVFCKTPYFTVVVCVWMMPDAFLAKAWEESFPEARKFECLSLAILTHCTGQLEPILPLSVVAMHRNDCLVWCCLAHF